MTRILLFSLLVVSGCGFRSGLDETSFTIESFTVDQGSYVQGELGEAQVKLRNSGPRPATLPELSFNISSENDVDDFTEAVVLAPDGPIAPGDLAELRYTFFSTESATPRDALAKLRGPDDAVIREVPFVLLRAATLEVNDLVFEAPPESAEIKDFTCRGLDRPAHVAATVKNIGARTANITEAGLVASENAVLFESHGENNPTAIEPGATAVFHMRIQALTTTPAGNDYTLRWVASYTDDTTGHARPEPGLGHDPLFLTVHRPAAFEVHVFESLGDGDSLVSGENAGLVQIEYVNVGTVTGRIDSASLAMAIGTDSTTDEYQFAPSSSFPITAGPQDTGEVSYTSVTLLSATPTTGETFVTGTLDATDATCERSFSAVTFDDDRGLWLVQ